MRDDDDRINEIKSAEHAVVSTYSSFLSQKCDRLIHPSAFSPDVVFTVLTDFG